VFAILESLPTLPFMTGLPRKTNATLGGAATVKPSTPLVSFGLPVYNGANFVADAIDCVLAQTYTNWELVICDNASTDQTMSICQAYADRDSRIRVHRNERNLGVSLNYNRAFELSSGSYFKWVTHDDLFGPESVESCLEALERDDQIALACPVIHHADAQGRLLRRQQSDLSITGVSPEDRVTQLMRLEVEGEDIYWLQFGLIRRSVLERTSLMGLYNGSDQVLLLEIALQGALKQVPGGSFTRREHPAASTLRRGWSATERAKFVCADDRRRVVFPYCRMLAEHLARIRQSSLAPTGKMRGTAAILRRFAGHWKDFAHEVIESPLEAMREGLNSRGLSA
jgi:hypothetical protein